MPRRREGEPAGASRTEPGGTAGTSPAILKALWVLRALRIAERDMGVADIARTVGLPMTTVHRILKTLVVAGYVVQNAETDQYHLGREAFLLGRAVAETLGFDTAQPLLEHLSATTGESVNLVVRDGNQGLVVLRIESDQPLRYIQPVGTTIPLYCTSSGKALLAFSADPAGEVDRLGELEALTPRTITSPPKLVEELHAIRERLFSVNRGERIAGVCGIAAPVLGSDGVAVAALAVQGPEFRIPDARIAEIGPLVIGAAQAIAATLPRGFQL
ncbi:MAG: IclR family transcriptional regulator [Actinomycetota bacterium]|nr:IclR family transcriptional regulator [Actinomycetota bacterium]MDA8341891.1 IclR family transcriptional regulator [Actinomycetota bacterium]